MPHSRTYWKDRPVLITGSTGLMGGWLVKELVDCGSDVVIIRRDRSPNNLLAAEGLIDRITVVEGSLADRNLLQRAMAEYSVETVFHLAAQPLVGVAKRDPVGTFEVNVAGTWNLLEAARQSGVKSVLVASSDKAYGASPTLPYVENNPLRGEYPYDVSKSCTDLISSCFARTYGMAVGITRCGNLFGGGDFNFSRMLPGLIQSTLRGERFVIRSDGKFIRDFLYVKDAVSAYLTFGEQLASNPSLAGEAFNFSMEVRASVLELVNLTLRVMNRTDLEPIIRNEASSEIREQYLDCTKAHELLGWNASYDLEQGVRETVDWYTQFLGARALSATT